MTAPRLKVIHHVKQLLPALGITEFSDANLQVVLDQLLALQKEFKLDPLEDLRLEVKMAMQHLMAGGTQTKVSSLNKAISAAQARSASKRSRPDVDSPAPSSSKLVTEAPSTARPSEEVKRKRASDAQAAARLPSPGDSFIVPRPATRFSDLAGLGSVQQQISELVCYPLQYPEIYSKLGIYPPTGILLHGPSGCGKTTMASAIAGETGLTYFKVSGPELIGGTSGESEQRIRDVFEAAMASAPSLLFIDALDVIAAKRDSHQRGMDRRIIAQLFDCIDTISQLGRRANDDSSSASTSDDAGATSLATTVEASDTSDDVPTPHEAKDTSLKKLVVLVVATNKPDSIDPGVRGRFAREIGLPVPDAHARAQILRLHAQSMRLHPHVEFSALGKLTPGFVGADLVCLTREAGMLAVSRIIRERQARKARDMDISDSEESVRPSGLTGEDEDCFVTMEDFVHASKSIQPSAKREGFAMAPDIDWSDVGALTEVREELRHNVLEPIAHPERFRALGLELPAGILFFGPPGCGKTLLAKALANQSGANFISVKGPELLNMYVGESESRVRQVFARARASAPCMIFFDELDALCPKRSSGWEGGGSSGNGVTERVVNQLLTELDGLESRKDVYIIGATNRLELIDEAMLRPGRLGNLLYVPLPTASERESILRALTRKVAIGERSAACEEGVDLNAVAFDPRCTGFSGADLSALVREAGLAVVKEKASIGDLSVAMGGLTGDPSDRHSGGQTEEKVSILARHFEAAFGRIRPSVSPEDRKKYELVRQLLKDGLSAIEALRKAFLNE